MLSSLRTRCFVSLFTLFAISFATGCGSNPKFVNTEEASLKAQKESEEVAAKAAAAHAAGKK